MNTSTNSEINHEPPDEYNEAESDYDFVGDDEQDDYDDVDEDDDEDEDDDYDDDDDDDDDDDEYDEDEDYGYENDEDYEDFEDEVIGKKQELLLDNVSLHSERESSVQHIQSVVKEKVLKKTETIPIEVLFGSSIVGAKPKAHDDDKPERESKETLEPLEKPTKMRNITKDIKFNITRELYVKPNKYTQFLSRSIKMTNNLHRPFLIFAEGVDYTPKLMIKPGDRGWMRKPMLLHFQKDFSTDELKLSSYSSGHLNYEPIFHKTEIDAEISSGDDNGDLEKEKLSLVYQSLSPPVKRMRVHFKLKETETFTIFDMVSQSAPVEDHEGKLIQIANSVFEERNNTLRKSIENYSQTYLTAKTRNKEIQFQPPPAVNTGCSMSTWEHFDTVKEIKEASLPITRKKKNLVGKLDKIEYSEIKSDVKPMLGKDFKIFNTIQWLKSGMIMERVLLSNNAMRQQLIFHDHYGNDLLSEKVDFTYKLQYLWTLKTEETKGKSVTSLCWSLHQPNIMAAGYGKYHFSDQFEGLVCVWNNKNLVRPERKFKFQQPVTCVQFCNIYPQVLAVSFYCGRVLLINILKQTGVKIIARNMPDIKTSVFPVWDIVWLNKGLLEVVVECRGDGCVYEYTDKHLKWKKRIMRITKIKGVIGGISQPTPCKPYVIPLVRHPSILCIALNPDDTASYYLGTDEGGVYKCSFKDVNQYTDVFLAHNGSVYSIQFHPACSKIFLTCGADWYIRIWADTIHDPLLTLSSGVSAVQSASWCLNFPTIIIAITDTNVELWDISRRIVLPQATYKNPQNVLNTSTKFSQCGNNLSVGDKEGSIHCFALRNMPFPPKNGDFILALSLIKVLRPKQKLLSELLKLGSPFNISRLYRRYVK